MADETRSACRKAALAALVTIAVMGSPAAGSEPKLGERFPSGKIERATGAGLASGLDRAASLTMGIKISEVPDPLKTLMGARLEDADGHDVGPVNAVRLDGEGRVAVVDVGVGRFLGFGGQSVSLRSDALTYNSERNRLVTPLREKQILAMAEDRR